MTVEIFQLNQVHTGFVGEASERAPEIVVGNPKA
jgi:hypothetical protein